MRPAQSLKTPCVLILALFALLAVPAWAQKSSGHRSVNSESQQKTGLEQIESQYPGLLEEFGRLAERIKDEVHLPPTRTQSRLLPLLPENTVGLVSLPNYGDALHQALTIFQQELNESAALRNWWKKADLGGPKLEDSLDKIYQVSQFLGDEIIFSAGTSGSKGNDPSFLVISEVKKPGLEPFLQQLAASLDERKTTPLHFLTPQELAAAGNDRKADEVPFLLRPDLLAISSDVATLRRLNTRIERHEAAFAANQFGQRLAQAYLNGGAGSFLGVDMQKILGDLPIGAAKNQEALQRSGFGDLKYFIWEHKDAPGQPTSQGELAFKGPRHGVASWLAAPAPLGGLDFISPNAGMVVAVALKSPARILDDVQELSGSSGPGPLAMLDMMGQELNINIKDDVLSKLTGEIVIEVEQAAQPHAPPAVKLVLRVNDADALQRTLGKLLEGAQMHVTPHREAGFTWNSMVFPSGQSMTEVAYAFVDGYLVLTLGSDALKEAVRVHRSGESLAKSHDFIAGLPPGHTAVASAMMYQNFAATMGSALGQLPPQFAQLLPKLAMSGGATSSFAYAEPTSIRWASNSGSVDVGVVLVVAAVAIPNLLRSRMAANESAALASLRTINTAEVTYITSYPEQGYARTLAAMGTPSHGECNPSATHACLLNSVLGCDSVEGCVKNGYRFQLTASCKGRPCADYVILAAPLGDEQGTRSFCSTEDAIIRFKKGAAHVGPLTAKECSDWKPIN